MPPKSKLGQNFLRDREAIARIAAAAGDCAGRTVVEIGPGRGAITHALVERLRADGQERLRADGQERLRANATAGDGKPGRLLCVELDRELAAGLRVEFLVSAPEVEVVEQSILDFDLTRAAEEAGQRLIVIGNLPYYITSDILLHLAKHHGAIERAILMVQREVAERVTAAPGCRDYGLLSATVQLYGPVQQLFTLPPSAFSPPPEVHSTVFRWRMEPKFEALGVEPRPFIGFLKKCFAQKRKTLANNLKAAGFDGANSGAALEAAGVGAQARAETLGLAEFANIFKTL
jgi:16S rRNA (adenine1518-N6/adenine1519-N6)-dimethyltransferase